MEITKRLIGLAEECCRLGEEDRPETLWLKTVYDRFRKESRLGRKSEADSLLYNRMYSRPPRTESEVLKIRYWRTGRHIPGNRSQCAAFGRALGLSEAEQTYLLCCDGFRHVIQPQEIYQALGPSAVSDEESMHSALVNLTELNKKRREEDNISAILIRTC